MKRCKFVTPILVILSIFGLYGVAFGGSGEPCPGCCENLPSPTLGPHLYGTFTVARDKSEASIYPEYAGYDVQIVLQHKLNQHLFSFFWLGIGDLCAFEASTLKTQFAKIPCTLEVGQPFGFDPAEFVPVISSLYISKRDFCGTEDEMISGMVTIRLVPLVPPKPPKPH